MSVSKSTALEQTNLTNVLCLSKKGAHQTFSWWRTNPLFR